MNMSVGFGIHTSKPQGKLLLDLIANFLSSEIFIFSAVEACSSVKQSLLTLLMPDLEKGMETKITIC